MERYGTDRPDTRYGMELTNVSDIVKDMGFKVFSGAVRSGGSVKCIAVTGGWMDPTPQAPPKACSTVPSSATVAASSSRGGVFATQSESPEAFRQVHIDMVKLIRELFGHADP